MDDKKFDFTTFIINISIKNKQIPIYLFLIEIRKSFDGRVRSQLKNSMINLPQMRDFERFKTNGDFEDVIRSVRRSIKGVEKTLTNVSKGKFP